MKISHKDIKRAYPADHFERATDAPLGASWKAVPEELTIAPEGQAFVLLRCRVTGKHYPDYNTASVPLRFCDVGDIIHARPDDVAALLDGGFCEYYGVTDAS